MQGQRLSEARRKKQRLQWGKMVLAEDGGLNLLYNLSVCPFPSHLNKAVHISTDAASRPVL